jgi:glycosyltransferase involved in cell wall biosynthesis
VIVSIGILARNEAPRIARTLQSLFRQSAFARLPDTRWELIVVPNGCSDDTAARAGEALADRPAVLEARVVELAERGKSNAWNRYVHELSRRDADVLLFLDGDIELAHPDTLHNALALLRSSPDCRVVVDRPIKRFSRARLSWIEKLSLRLSRETDETEAHPAVMGQFYCARAASLREIWIPDETIGEDSLVGAMLTTDYFRAPPDRSRILRADGAAHYYEGLSRPAAILRRETRMVIGTALNCYLFWDFLRFATDPAGAGAGLMIRRRLEQDRGWHRNFLDNEIRNRGWWVLPRGLLFRRFARLAARPRKLRRLPLALIGFLFDLVVFAAANRRLKRGTAIGYW